MPSNRTEQALARLADLTPRQIVAELDRYIVGQNDAKKAVAIALRNRWRRQRTPDAIRDEISPNNIILIGPTGVGKTEIARRLAKLAGAPFIKVEASKFTEVGYVGRDVESMVRDLVESAIDMVRTEREAEVEDLAHERVEERLLDLLLPAPNESRPGTPAAPAEESAAGDEGQASSSSRPAATSRRSASTDAGPRALSAHARQAAPAAPRRAARAARGRDRGDAAAPRRCSTHDPAGRPRGDGELHRDAPRHAARAQKKRTRQGGRGPPHPPRAGIREAHRPRRRHHRRPRARRAARHHLPRRDRQDRRGPRRLRRTRRLARGRAARPPADRRGLQRPDEVRPGEDRPRPLHRRRRVSRLQAQRPHSRAAGTVSHPGRAQAAHRGGLRPDHDRARERAHQAVRRARRGRGRRARLHARRDRGNRAHRRHRQRAHGEHRRAPPAHGHDHAARGGPLHAARSVARNHHSQQRTSCRNASAPSWKTRTSGSTSSRSHAARIAPTRIALPPASHRRPHRTAARIAPPPARLRPLPRFQSPDHPCPATSSPSPTSRAPSSRRSSRSRNRCAPVDTPARRSPARRWRWSS